MKKLHNKPLEPTAALPARRLRLFAVNNNGECKRARRSVRSTHLSALRLSGALYRAADIMNASGSEAL